MAGILNLNGAPAEPELVQSMLGLLAHRRPDREGILLDAAAALGHTRLSIIDLQGGHQPISNPDETLWISFNGQIFNYLELRSRLVERGYVFRTQSDREVLLHLYEEYGSECVGLLNGQWAFAV